MFFNEIIKMAIKWLFFGQTGQILFQVTNFTLYFDIMAKKTPTKCRIIFLGDLTWNRPVGESIFFGLHS